MIIISKEQLKTGQGKFGPWTLYKVKANDGKTYTTFEDLQLDCELDLDVEPPKAGSKYQDYTLKSKKTEKFVTWAAFNKLADRVGELERWKAEYTSKDASFQQAVEEKPKDEVPF